MLKGILFVIAIIITFDIGKALLKSWQAEEEAPALVKEVVDDVKPDRVESDKAESGDDKSDDALEDVPVLINLELPEEAPAGLPERLPEETTETNPEELEQDEAEKNTSSNFSPSQ